MMNGLQGAIAKGAARWAGGIAAGLIFGFLASHSQILAWVNQACASLSSEDALKEFCGGAAIALATLFFAVKDKLNVNGKMATAAATAFDKGQSQAIQQAAEQGANVQPIGNGTKAAAVSAALQHADTATKEDKAAVVDALKKGAF